MVGEQQSTYMPWFAYPKMSLSSNWIAKNISNTKIHINFSSHKSLGAEKSGFAKISTDKIQTEYTDVTLLTELNFYTALKVVWLPNPEICVHLVKTEYLLIRTY